MIYSFKERQLSDQFCTDKQTAVNKFLSPSGIVTINGMSSVGISLFIRFLATRQFAEFVYLDLLSLSSLTKYDFWTSLLNELGGQNIPNNEAAAITECKTQIQRLIKSNQHLVILLNRFDELDSQIDKNFLANLRTLRHIAADQISIIFVVHKKFYDSSIAGANLDMFSNLVYFTPYQKAELKILLELYEGQAINNFDEIYQLSGGHFQLARLLLKSEVPDSPLQDKFISISLKQISDSLTTTQKQQLRRLAFGKKLTQADIELLKLGIVNQHPDGYQIFSPLLAQYLLLMTGIKLPLKETKLFQLLKKNLGKVVSKDEIFQTVWTDGEEEFMTDWSLNSLIYRLRKNPTILASDYTIESYKKVGYLMRRG